MNQSALLFSLQKIDDELSLINARIEEIERQLSDNQQIRKTEELLQNIRNNIRDHEKSLNDINFELNELRIKKQTSESMIYSGKIQNPKELQDLSQEIEFLKKRIDGIQHGELNIMLEVERLEQELLTAEEDLKVLQSDSERIKSLLRGEKSGLEEKVAKLKEQRQATTNSITTDNLSIYHRLFETKRGLAVAKIQDDSCSACGNHIRPAEKQAANNPQQMAFCTSCGRILYSG